MPGLLYTLYTETTPAGFFGLDNAGKNNSDIMKRKIVMFFLILKTFVIPACNFYKCRQIPKD
jgi:hypothetical protein